MPLLLRRVKGCHTKSLQISDLRCKGSVDGRGRIQARLKVVEQLQLQQTGTDRDHVNCDRSHEPSLQGLGYRAGIAEPDRTGGEVSR